MKRINLLIVALIAAFGVHAQSLERDVVSTGGSTLQTSSVSLEFTIGESVIGNFTDGTTTLGNGYNQVVASSSVGVEVLNVQNLRVLVYPNPADDYITVEGTGLKQVVIIDCFGRRCNVPKTQGINSDNRQELNVSNLSSGVYFLRVDDGSGHSTLVKWIKQ